MSKNYTIDTAVFNDHVRLDLSANNVPSKVARIISGAIIDKQCKDIDIRDILIKSDNVDAVKYADKVEAKCLNAEMPKNWREIMANEAAMAMYLEKTR